MAPLGEQTPHLDLGTVTPAPPDSRPRAPFPNFLCDWLVFREAFLELCLVLRSTERLAEHFLWSESSGGFF